MNLRSLAVCVIAMAFALPRLAAQTDNVKWKLVWQDDFEKDGKIDKKKWTKIPRGGADWNRHMSNDKRCYEVKDGVLILRGIVNDKTKKDTAKYLTGGVYTKGKFSYTYGKVEIRAKLGSAKGAWPAFWALPEHSKWPDGGEIDIMEHLNYEDSVYQTIHSNYTLVLKEKENPKYSTLAPFNKDDFNVFGMEKHPDKIVFSINGKVTHVYPKIVTDKPDQFPFNEPYYILIDMQLGGSWVGAVDPTTLPVQMEIDWVKIYQTE